MGLKGLVYITTSGRAMVNGWKGHGHGLEGRPHGSVEAGKRNVSGSLPAHNTQDIAVRKSGAVGARTRCLLTVEVI